MSPISVSARGVGVRGNDTLYALLPPCLNAWCCQHGHPIHRAGTAWQQVGPHSLYISPGSWTDLRRWLPAGPSTAVQAQHALDAYKTKDASKGVCLPARASPVPAES